MDFINSAGAWATGQETGLDKVDVWVGGLADMSNLFGGLLGKTFKYVFQTSLTNLQNGDRLYYLARTPGMNLRAQLESNSFAEMIMRNTDNTHSLKADAFATADCKFQLANLAGTPQGSPQFGGARRRPPPPPTAMRTSCSCASPTARSSTRQKNTVDPAGINGQSVYNGTDTLTGSRAATTTTPSSATKATTSSKATAATTSRSAATATIVTDLSGADVLKGGPGNDYIDSGIGDDIIHGRRRPGLHQRRRQRQRNLRRAGQRLRHRR